MDNDSPDFRKSTHNKLYACHNSVFNSWLDLLDSNSIDALLLDASSVASYGKARKAGHLWFGLFIFSWFDPFCSFPKSPSKWTRGGLII